MYLIILMIINIQTGKGNFLWAVRIAQIMPSYTKSAHYQLLTNIAGASIGPSVVFYPLTNGIEALPVIWWDQPITAIIQLFVDALVSTLTRRGRH